MAKYFQVGLAFEDRGAINSVINHIVFDSVHYNDLIIIGQRGYQGACRRDDGGIHAGSGDCVENAVLIVVIGVCVSITLYQAKFFRQFVGGQCAAGIEGVGGILSGDAGILLRNDKVLACNYIVIIERSAVSAVSIAVIGETDGVQDSPVDSPLKRSAERRTANDIRATIAAVVDTVVEIIVDSPMADTTPRRRQAGDPISVIVRMVSPEIAGTVPRHRIPLTGSNAHDIVRIVHPHIVVVTVVAASVTVNLFFLGRLCTGITAKAAAANVGRTDGGTCDGISTAVGT